MAFPKTPSLNLFLLSFLMLFVELALIRWLSESVLYLGFFTNIVLVASFLGVGIGFLTRSYARWIRWFPTALFLLLASVIAFPVGVDRSASDVIFIGSGRPAGLPIWLVLPLIFLASAVILATIAHQAAFNFRQLDPLSAYRVDIAGSLIGIASFALLAALGTPPIVWGTVIVLVACLAAWSLFSRLSRVALGGIIVLLAAQSLTPGWTWSPYYRVEVLRDDKFQYISVNGIPHQATGTISDLRDLDWVADWPYRARASKVPPAEVLIVGAGNGNDVAFALEWGAKHVDAVEIDPRIYELGVSLNPERPYSNPRVDIHIDDGRAFMQRTDRTWDLILFALPDSLVSVAGQSNLRLESYLFTSQAFTRAKALLTDEGVFATYNLHSDSWVVDRMARTMKESFGSTPCMLGSAAVSRVMLAVGPGVDPTCPGGTFVSGAEAPAPVTDDRPYLYVRSRGIPGIYVAAIAGMALVALAAVRIGAGRTPAITKNSDLFLMGAAFLLLETKSIGQFALWFGTTWNVNVLVFSGVLVSVLLAIEVSRTWRPSLSVLYLILGAAVLASWLIRPEALLALQEGVRWVAAVVISFPPIFVANLIFASRFREAESTTDAFGANLLGAIAGGLLEYTTIVIGHRALSLVVGVLYGGSFLAWRVLDTGRRKELMATASAQPGCVR